MPIVDSTPSARSWGRRGFTLIELLTVIAIIGILAAILIPTVSGVRASASKAKTKAQLAQWVSAMELFKQEYGYYPAIDNGTGLVVTTRFVGALTGRKLDGSTFSASSDPELCGNKKQISFYTLAEGELSGTSLLDAFENVEFGVRYDKNGDGRITKVGDGELVQVRSVATGNQLDLTKTDVDQTNGVRAGVVLYTAGRGRDETDLIYSWR